MRYGWPSRAEHTAPPPTLPWRGSVRVSLGEGPVRGPRCGHRPNERDDGKDVTAQSHWRHALRFIDPFTRRMRIKCVSPEGRPYGPGCPCRGRPLVRTKGPRRQPRPSLAERGFRLIYLKFRKNFGKNEKTRSEGKGLDIPPTRRTRDSPGPKIARQLNFQIVRKLLLQAVKNRVTCFKNSIRRRCS